MTEWKEQEKTTTTKKTTKTKQSKTQRNNNKANGINYRKNWKRFNAIEGHTFLGTIVPKSSIKEQFVPLQIRNLEQLVPLLAIHDHFVPKKHQSTSRWHQKEHKEEEQSVLVFQEGTVQKSRKGTALKSKMCSKTSFVKTNKAKKRLKYHFEEQNQMPKLHWTK